MAGTPLEVLYQSPYPGGNWTGVHPYVDYKGVDKAYVDSLTDLSYSYKWLLPQFVKCDR